jgi:3'(2'), 5'-bisphosphate nucleotidase
MHVYPRLHPTSEWDTGAGQCLLEIMGGGLVDVKGRPFTYNQREGLLNNDFLAVRDARYLPLVLPMVQQVLAAAD